MNYEDKKENNKSSKTSLLWTIVIGIFVLAFKILFNIFKSIFKDLFSNGKNNTRKTTSVKNRKTQQKKKGKMTAYDILLARGYTEKQVLKAIKNCQRDIEMAMDDGAMEELEDIVVEDLGVDPRHVEELI